MLDQSAGFLIRWRRVPESNINTQNKSETIPAKIKVMSLPCMTRMMPTVKNRALPSSRREPRSWPTATVRHLALAPVNG